MSQEFKNRMETVRVRVTDGEGKAVPGAKVRFRETKQEFLLGAGAFDTLKLPDPFTEERVEKWLKLLNYGTLPFYWGGYEPVEGAYEEESRMKAAKFLLAHDVTPKGHPLCWHTSCADWLLKYDNKTIMEKQLARITRDVTAFRGVIDIWDVINETVIMPVFDRYDNAITRICNAYGRINLIKEVFDAAKAANPDALLLINDFNLSPEYEKVIDEALTKGVPIGAIGLQTHQHQGYRGKAYMEDVIRRFSKFGLPLHFTENTLVSGHLMPPEIVDLNDYQVSEWPSTAEGEARQEQEWKEMAELMFGSDEVDALTGWDFADGAWLHAPSGLVRLDNSEKPAYKMLCKLFREEWMTDVTCVTDEAGYADFTGYRGKYEVSSDGKNTEFVLKKGLSEAEIVL
ncbi:MAG: endo-1,4-beta-xylanase [Lachnospiraceae bacterium]|nr:endo-1,4-beta-xylanase [Lachnospiraceae bacterium]